MAGKRANEETKTEVAFRQPGHGQRYIEWVTEDYLIEKGEAVPVLETNKPPVSPYVVPKNTVEETLVAIWREILHTEGIGTQDSFFELGGNSLTAIRMVDQLREAGHTISIMEVFKHPTIDRLADVIIELEEGIAKSEKPVTSRKKAVRNAQ